MTARLVRALALTALLTLVLGGGSPGARASDAIEVTSARLEMNAEGDGWLLAANFELPLPARMEEAVNRGVALYFLVEFELYRPRWYWWDDKLAQASQSYRLSYHALTRQYRVTINGFQQSHATLQEAVKAISFVRGLRVVDADKVRAGTAYDGFVRMRLDIAQLPKPFQVTAITNRDWNLQAEWKRFTFTPEAPKAETQKSGQ